MTDCSQKDRVFNKPLTSVKAFEFDEEVTRVFDDMISRSVPGYDLLVKLIALYADLFITPESQIYDLGCSTGIVSRVIAQQVSDRNCVIHAVDNSPAMIHQCQQVHQGLEINWQCRDIQDLEVNSASMVILNLTLQFIKPDQRIDLLSEIYRGLNPGGVLVLTEKIEFQDRAAQNTMTELYHAFKKVQGYSDLEISQKRAALENVLIPETTEQHRKRLSEVGFSQVYECFHCLNFVSFLAIKD